MALTSLYILGGILLFIVIVLIIYLVSLKFKEEEDLENYEIFKNYMPQHANGYSGGIILDRIKGEKQEGIIFMPKDINFNKIKKKEKIIVEQQIVFFKKDRITSINLSAHRTEIWGIPENAEDLPESLKDTQIGRAIMTFIKNKNVKSHEVEVLRGEVDSVRLVNNKLSDKEYLNQLLDYKDEFHKDSLKSVAKEEKKLPDFRNTQQ
jgi:hypothetical protein